MTRDMQSCQRHSILICSPPLGAYSRLVAAGTHSRQTCSTSPATWPPASSPTPSSSTPQQPRSLRSTTSRCSTYRQCHSASSLPCAPVLRSSREGVQVAHCEPLLCASHYTVPRSGDQCVVLYCTSLRSATGSQMQQVVTVSKQQGSECKPRASRPVLRRNLLDVGFSSAVVTGP